MASVARKSRVGVGGGGVETWLVFLTHGFLEDDRRSWLHQARNSVLERYSRRNRTVVGIIVDWGWGSENPNGPSSPSPPGGGLLASRSAAGTSLGSILVKKKFFSK